MGCKESVPIRGDPHVIADEQDISLASGEAQSHTSASLPAMRTSNSDNNNNNNNSNSNRQGTCTSEPQADHSAAGNVYSNETGRRRAPVPPRAFLERRRQSQQQQQQQGEGGGEASETPIACHFDPILPAPPDVPAESTSEPVITTSTAAVAAVNGSSVNASPTAPPPATTSHASGRPPPLTESPPTTDAAQAAQEYQQLVEHKRQAALEQRQQRSLEEFDPIRPLDSFNITHRGLLGRCWDRRHPELVPITLAYLAALNKTAEGEEGVGEAMRGEDAELMHFPNSPLTVNAAGGGGAAEDTFGPPHHRHHEHHHLLPNATVTTASVSSQQSSPTMPNKSFASEACWCGVHRSSHWFTAAGMDFRSAASAAIAAAAAAKNNNNNNSNSNAGSPLQQQPQPRNPMNSEPGHASSASRTASAKAEDRSTTRGSANNILRGADAGTGSWYNSPTLPTEDATASGSSPLYPSADDLARRTNAEREAIFNKAIVKELGFSGIKANFAFHVARGFSETADAKPLQRRNLRPAYGVRIRYWNHVSLVHPNLRTLARVAALTEHQSDRIAAELSRASLAASPGSAATAALSAAPASPPPAALPMRPSRRAAAKSERRSGGGGVRCCSAASPVRLSGPSVANEATCDSGSYDTCNNGPAGSPMAGGGAHMSLSPGRAAEPGNLLWERLLRLQTIDLDTDTAHTAKAAASTAAAEKYHTHHRHAQQQQMQQMQVGSNESPNASFGQKLLVNDSTALHRALGITTSTMKGSFFLTDKTGAGSGSKDELRNDDGANDATSSSSSFPMDCILCYVMSLPLRRLLQLDGMPATLLRQQLAQLCLTQKNNTTASTSSSSYNNNNNNSSGSACDVTLNDLLRRLPRQAQYILRQSLTGPHALHNLHVEERRLFQDSFHSIPYNVLDGTGSGSTANSSNSPPPPHGLLEHHGSRSSNSEPGTATSPNATLSNTNQLIITSHAARSGGCGPTRIVAMEVCCFSAAIDPLRWRQHRYNRHPVEIDLSRPSARREYGEGIITEIMYGGTLVIECGCAAAADYLAEVLADMSWSADNSLAGIVMDVKRRVRLRKEKEERQRAARTGTAAAASPSSAYGLSRVEEKVKKAKAKTAGKSKATSRGTAGGEAMANVDDFRYRICQRIGGHPMRDTVEFKAISQLLLVGTVVEEHTISRPTREVAPTTTANDKKATAKPSEAKAETSPKACEAGGAQAVPCAAHISAAVGGSGGGTLGLGPSETPTFSRVASAWVDLRTIVVVMHTWGIHLLAHPEYAMPMAFYLQRYAGIAPALKSSTLSTLSFHDASLMEDEAFADSEELELEFYEADAGLPPPPPRTRSAAQGDAQAANVQQQQQQQGQAAQSSSTTTTGGSGSGSSVPAATVTAVAVPAAEHVDNASLQHQQQQQQHAEMIASLTSSSSYKVPVCGSAESLSNLAWASRVPTAPYIAHDYHGHEALACDTPLAMDMEHMVLPSKASEKKETNRKKNSAGVDVGQGIGLPPSLSAPASSPASSPSSSSTPSSSSSSSSLVPPRKQQPQQQAQAQAQLAGPVLEHGPPPPMTPLTRSNTNATFNHVDSVVSPCATMGTALPTPTTLSKPPHHHSHPARHARRRRRRRRNSSPPLSTSAPTVPQTPALGLHTATPSPAENIARVMIPGLSNNSSMVSAVVQNGRSARAEPVQLPASTSDAHKAGAGLTQSAKAAADVVADAGTAQRPVSPMPALPTRAEQTTMIMMERGVVSVPSSGAVDVEHEVHTGKNAGEEDEGLDPLQQQQQQQPGVHGSHMNTPLYSGKRWSTSGTSDTESMPTTLHSSIPGLAEDEERWRMTMLELRALQQELQEMYTAREEAERRYNLLHTRLYILQRAFLPHGVATELELVFLYLTTALREPEELFGGCLYLSDADWLPMLVAVWTAPQCRVRVVDIAAELTWRDLPKLGVLAGLLYYCRGEDGLPPAALEQLRINAAKLLGDPQVIAMNSNTSSGEGSERDGKPRKSSAVRLLLARGSSRRGNARGEHRPNAHHTHHDEDEDEEYAAAAMGSGDEGQDGREPFALSRSSLLAGGNATMGTAANHGLGVYCPPFIITPEQARDTLWLLLCAVAANGRGAQFRLTLYDYPLSGEELHRYRKHAHDADYDLAKAHTFSLHRTLSSIFSRKKTAEPADEVAMRQDSLSLGSFVILSPGSPGAMGGSFSPASVGGGGGAAVQHSATVDGAPLSTHQAHSASPMAISHTMKDAASPHSLAGSSSAAATYRTASVAGDSFVLPLDPAATSQAAARTHDKHGLLVHVHHALKRDWLRPKEVCVESRAFHTVLYHMKEESGNASGEEPHALSRSLTIAPLTSSSSSLSALRGTTHHHGGSGGHHYYINPFNANHNSAEYWLPPARQRKLEELAEAAAIKAAENNGSAEPIADTPRAAIPGHSRDVEQQAQQQPRRRIFGLGTIAKEQQVLVSEEGRLYGQADKIWHVLYKSVKQHNRDVMQAHNAEGTGNGNAASASVPSRMTIVLEPC